MLNNGCLFYAANDAGGAGLFGVCPARRAVWAEPEKPRDARGRRGTPTATEARLTVGRLLRAA